MSMLVNCEHSELETLKNNGRMCCAVRCDSIKSPECKCKFFFTIHVSLTIRYAIMNHNLSVAMKSSDFQSRHIINKNKKNPINPIRENWIELQQFA